MDGRQKNLFDCIVKEYIKTAQPVSSGLLVKKYKLGLSPATVRNEMVKLEEQGYICQPHTSAGRIPTEKGYKFYIQNFLKDKKSEKAVENILSVAKQEVRKDRETLIKEIAKKAADYSKETIIIAFSPDNIYYTGIANLFSQPEFQEQGLLQEMSSVIDRLDKEIEQLFDEVDSDVKVLVGKENPLGRECSAVFITSEIIPKQKSVVCLLGPMRMDYEKNMALIEYVHRLLL